MGSHRASGVRYRRFLAVLPSGADPRPLMAPRIRWGGWVHRGRGFAGVNGVEPGPHSGGGNAARCRAVRVRQGLRAVPDAVEGAGAAGVPLVRPGRRVGCDHRNFPDFPKVFPVPWRAGRSGSPRLAGVPMSVSVRAGASDRRSRPSPSDSARGRRSTGSLRAMRWLRTGQAAASPGG